MELCIFARFHARLGQEEALAALMRAQLQPVRSEPGCLRIDAFRSTRDLGLVFFYSRWLAGWMKPHSTSTPASRGHPRAHRTLHIK